MMRTIAQAAKELGKPKTTIKTWVDQLSIPTMYDEDQTTLLLSEEAFATLQEVKRQRDEKIAGMKTLRRKIEGGQLLINTAPDMIPIVSPVVAPETLQLLAAYMVEQLTPIFDAREQVGQLTALVQQQGTQIDGLIAEVAHLKTELQQEKRKTWIDRLFRRD